MPMREHSTSASSIECVVRTMLRSPFSRNFNIIFHNNLRLRGSRPVLGSSKNTILLSPASAMPTESRRRMPPLSCLDSLCFLLPSSSNNFNSSSTCSRSLFCGTVPRRRVKKSKCSSGVKLGHNVSNCGHTPVTRVRVHCETLSSSTYRSVCGFAACVADIGDCSPGRAQCPK